MAINVKLKPLPLLVTQLSSDDGLSSPTGPPTSVGVTDKNSHECDGGPAKTDDSDSFSLHHSC